MKLRIRPYAVLALLVSLSAWTAGCSSQSGPDLGSPPSSEGFGDDHGHDHSHGHDHGHLGPHEGHLVEVGNDNYHLEWAHDDATGKITVYVLGGDAKELAPIEAAEIVIERTIKSDEGDDVKEYKLAAVNPTADDPPKAAQFEITDKALLTALQAVGHGVEANIYAPLDGKVHTGVIEHDDHGHGHAH